MRYVWLNINTGEFSESWSQIEEEDAFEYRDDDIPEGWKLIKYSCENDDMFDFNSMMKIVTSLRKRND